jgi:solute carrier family 35 protein C2
VPSSIAAARGGTPPGTDIEMAPITGHRRRKSSILSPIPPPGAAAGAGAGSSPTGSPSRPRSLSLRSPGHGASGFGYADGAEDIAGSPSAWKTDREDTDSGASDEDLHDDEETGLTKKEKRRKQRKRRRNTLLDQRIAQEKGISADEVRAADKNVVRRIVINVLLVLLWYLLSLSISLVRRDLVSQHGRFQRLT